MTNVEKIRAALIGKYLRGIMPLNRADIKAIESLPHPDPYEYGEESVGDLGSIGHAVAFYFKDSPDVILVTPHQAYSCFDTWVALTTPPAPIRDDRYKAIGEEILAVEEVNAPEGKWSVDGVPFTQFIVRTASKVMAFGHQWNDCHYPSSLWNEGPAVVCE